MKQYSSSRYLPEYKIRIFCFCFDNIDQKGQTSLIVCTIFKLKGVDNRLALFILTQVVSWAQPVLNNVDNFPCLQESEHVMKLVLSGFEPVDH